MFKKLSDFMSKESVFGINTIDVFIIVSTIIFLALTLIFVFSVVG